MRARGRPCLAASVVLVAAGAIGCTARRLDPGGQGTSALDAGGAPDTGGAAGAAGAGGAVGADGGVDRDRGRILLIPTGQPCETAADCLTGFCSDGVCCSGRCADACLTCAAPGQVGTCVNRPAGDLPRAPAVCPVDAASICGSDGTCDGYGACRFRPLNTPCGSGHCDSDAVVGGMVCDGRGHCRTGSTIICVPYRCDPATASCRTQCVDEVDCPGSYCESGGRCHVNTGPTCTRGDQCASGFCTGGVCCNTACNDPCVTCNLPNRVGTCSPRPDGCPGADGGGD